MYFFWNYTISVSVYTSTLPQVSKILKKTFNGTRFFINYIKIQGLGSDMLKAT